MCTVDLGYNDITFFHGSYRFTEIMQECMDKLRHLIVAAAKIGVVAPLTRASANIKGNLIKITPDT